jgi:DHA1 family bicyclomycin/chloramphenicol resistance-like MFS transporter
MPESLTPNKRRTISLNNLKEATIETLTNRNSMVYTISAGLIFGAFIGYLSSSAQIFEDVFNQKKNFPILFGSLALSIGSASFFNSKLVDKMGMKKLTLNALKALSTLAASFLIISYLSDSSNNLVFFLSYMLLSFFCIGTLFGNFNALAISPLGHIAGIATAIISSVQTFIFLIFGTLIGQMYNFTVYPLVIGFFTLSTLSFISIKRFTTN